MNETLEFLGERHLEIYREVDRLYHSCMTSEGRCAVIADYILRLLNEQDATEAGDEQEAR